MGTTEDPLVIAELPSLSEFVTDLTVAGFPSDFSAQFEGKQRLLRVALHDCEGVMVFRNTDLREVATNPAIGMSIASRQSHRLFRNLVFTTNPPVHGPMRQVIARPFNPRSISSLHDLAREVAAKMLDSVAGEGEIDFCSGFSERFTAQFWGTFFGMSDAEIDSLAGIVRAISPTFLLAPKPEETAAVHLAMDSYLELVGNAVERSVQQGANQLVQIMASAFNDVDCETKPDRFGEMVAANLFDGLHTVAVGGTNALYQLLSSPDELRTVRANPNLVANALREGMRLWPPLIYTSRSALRDIEFARTLIPRGTVITMLWAAGNRDPQAFNDPNRYDLFRHEGGETTFGGGVHICPGRHVVRMLTQVMLEAVLAADLRIELSGLPPAWIRGSSLRQLDRMQVTIKRH